MGGRGANFPAFQKDTLPSEGSNYTAKALPLGPEEQPNEGSQRKHRRSKRLRQ